MIKLEKGEFVNFQEVKLQNPTQGDWEVEYDYNKISLEVIEKKDNVIIFRVFRYNEKGELCPKGRITIQFL